MAKKDHSYTQKVYSLFGKYIHKTEFSMERFTYNF
jgi:hypothetical protein